ncbi:MAG: hypothetical protein AAGC63_08660 [Propionicimonas sp.]|nr:hypothetical protein [Propionicimonas sp.]
MTVLLAAALLTGDVWLTRAGAVIAFLGGLASTLLAWREVKLQRAGYELRSTLDLRAHGEKLHGEREQHTRLLRILQQRNQQLRSRATTARAEAGRLGHEVARLRGDNASLVLENTGLVRDNDGLKLEIARLNESRNAEILALPRRVSGAPADGEEILWSEENQPTVVDLKAITAPFAGEAKRTLA